MSEKASVTPTPPPKRGTGIGVSIFGVVVGLCYLAGHAGLFKKGLGENASSADDCRSGQLLPAVPGSNLGGVCSASCKSDGDCGSGVRCLSGNCAPLGHVKFGQPCFSPWDCEGDLCFLPMSFGEMLASKRGAVSVCSQMCTSMCVDCVGGCPAGSLCLPSDEGLACWPSALISGLRDAGSADAPD